MKNIKKLVLLHSNDMHGDFLAEDVDSKLTGGVSMLSAYINKVREEEKNVLYVIAGDMFRGSVIDSEFMGLSTIEIMNMLSPDVVTLGNHETDYGLAHLLFIEKCAKFPIINANLHITTNNARLFKPYEIIEIDGMRILFIGILTEEVMAQTRHDGLIGSIVDVAEAAREVGRICNAHRGIDIDFTVLLTHIGFEEDKKLAERLDPAWGVDVIIGGHSHTMPEEAVEVNGVLIVQAGTGTDFIGRFDLNIDTDTNSTDSYTWTTIPIDETHCSRDEDIENLIEYYKTKTDAKYNRVLTRFETRLTHPERTQETTLGSLFADIMKESLGLDIYLLGSGSIRNPELGPIVMFSNLKECFPYDDSSHMIVATGAQLKRMIRHMLRDEVWSGDHCEFYQLSKGLEVEYDLKTRSFIKFNYEGEPIDEDRKFTVGLQDFHFKNFPEFFNISREEIEANRKPRVIATSTFDILDEYLSHHQRLWRGIEGRLVIRR
ncbi:MAG TPA: bifunctional UDP-sugar hydrolase/5'-nucleotidase [Bacillota bacterium]|nr:bifunctional UDP-sugar hydrolase/5'-nucleotidase [Bacillota bacterium]HQC35892.1 bifunctional UDP-sugar hydrolase/5'-nucleotidase [Bacillota bacterium]